MSSLDDGHEPRPVGARKKCVHEAEKAVSVPFAVSGKGPG